MTSLRNIKYRASSGEDFDFDFDFDPRDGWRVYITSQPDYGSRSRGEHETHRYNTGGRPYICWDTPIRTAEDAREIAAMWAEATLHYIATGIFTVPGNRPEVRNHGETPFQREDLPTLR